MCMVIKRRPPPPAWSHLPPSKFDHYLSTNRFLELFLKVTHDIFLGLTWNYVTQFPSSFLAPSLSFFPLTVLQMKHRHNSSLRTSLKVLPTTPDFFGLSHGNLTLSSSESDSASVSLSLLLPPVPMVVVMLLLLLLLVFPLSPSPGTLLPLEVVAITPSGTDSSARLSCVARGTYVYEERRLR